MATTQFYLSNRENAETGKKEVFVRFFHGRKIDSRAKTNIFINPATWNEKTQRVIIPRLRVMDSEAKAELSERAESNKKLELLAEHIQKQFIAAGAGKVAENIGRDWLPSIIENYTFPDVAAKRAAAANDLFSCLRVWIDKKEDSRYKDHYEVFARSLKRFELYTGERLTFENLTAGKVDEYKLFLENEHELLENEDYKAAFEKVPESRQATGRSQETIRNYLIKLRAFTNAMREYENGNEQPKMRINPFANYVLPDANYDKRIPYYPTLEERNKLWHFDFSDNPALERQRDVFIFQCVIGCRVSDLRNLTRSNVYNGFLEFIPIKTKKSKPVTARVPLNSIAREILAKYENLPGDKLLPCISDQKYNDAIKKMFKLAGLDRVVTVIEPITGAEQHKPLHEVASSHIARRCFIGNLYKQIKDPKLISELTKHSEDSRSFKRYRAVDDDTLKSVVDLLEG